MDLTWADCQQTIEIEAQQRELQHRKKISKKEPVQGAMMSETDTRICFKCKQQGHIKRDCRGGYSRGRGRGNWSRGRGRGRGHDVRVAKEDSANEDFVFNADQDGKSGQGWLIDSGASSHMTFELKMLEEYQEFETKEFVSLGDGKTISADGKGTVKLKFSTGKVAT
jgi:hypothetical protein